MSEIRVNAVKNTSGVERYLAQAWVNFNGTGTVAIRASGNVTSITDNGVGDYTVNFTNAMADANYCPVGTVTKLSPDDGNATIQWKASAALGLATGSLRMKTFTVSGNSVEDYAMVSVAIFR